MQLLTLLALVLITAALVGYRQLHDYRSSTEALLSALETDPETNTSTVDFTSLSGLPPPVIGYFRHVLRDGQPFVRSVALRQTGVLKVSPDAADWSRFYAEQLVTRRGFVWDAKVEIAPLLHVRVRDSLLDGHGAGEVRLMSMVTLGTANSSPELDNGALYRYLAEAVWYPTALLPSAGVVWHGIDAQRARATLRVGEHVASIEFSFSEQHEISGLYTEGRYGTFDGSFVRYPWEGRFSDYIEVGGMRIPSRGEVGWHLPQGWWLFWRGEVVDVDYAYTRTQ